MSSETQTLVPIAELNARVGHPGRDIIRARVGDALATTWDGDEAVPADVAKQIVDQYDAHRARRDESRRLLEIEQQHWDSTFADVYNGAYAHQAREALSMQHAALASEHAAFMVPEGGLRRPTGRFDRRARRAAAEAARKWMAKNPRPA